MTLFGHLFEFVDLESKREFFGGVSVHDYQVIVDNCMCLSRAELWDADPTLGAFADAAAVTEHEKGEELVTSQNDDYAAWRKS